MKTVLDLIIDEHQTNGTTIQEFIDAVIVITKDYRDINSSQELAKAIAALEQARAHVDQADTDLTKGE